MRSSGAVAALPITGRCALPNLLPVVLPAVPELVLLVVVVVRLVTALPEPTQQAARIST